MKVLEEQIVTEGKFYNYIIQKLDTKDNYQYEYVKKVSDKGGVEIIPIIKCPAGNKLLCILNYRYPLHSYVLEFPGGCVDENENFEQTAKRELEEETGLKCDQIYGHKRTYFVDPWKSNDQNNIFYAIINAENNCDKNLCKEQKLDEIENIKVLFLDMNKLDQEIDKVVKKFNCKVSISLGYFLMFQEMFKIINKQLNQFFY